MEFPFFMDMKKGGLSVAFGISGNGGIGNEPAGLGQHGGAFDIGHRVFDLIAEGGAAAHFAFHSGDALDNSGMLAVEAVADLFEGQIRVLAET